jgi:hypothetical protein
MITMTQMTLTPPTVAELLHAFRDQISIVRAILELTVEQRQFIAEDDYASLKHLLERKQRLVNHLDRRRAEYADIWSAWGQSRHTLSGADRTACDHSVAQLNDLLRDLLSVEQSSIDTVSERRNSTLRELQTLSAAYETQHAYQSMPPPITALDLST